MDASVTTPRIAGECMHIVIKALAITALAAAPLHAQTGCEQVDATSVTRVIRSQRLATEPGRFIDDGGGTCRVTFGGEAGPTQVIVIRLELDDVDAVRGSMQVGRGGGPAARSLSGVGDEAFVAATPSGDGAVAEARDGTALVMIQVLTQRGTNRARTAAAADIARLLFGVAAVEPAAAATVADARRNAEPEPRGADTASAADDEPAATDDEPAERDEPTPISIPEFADGPGDVCAALPGRVVREALSAAGLTSGGAKTARAPGLCVYTFGVPMTDSAVRVTVQYAGARDPASGSALVASIRRRSAARALTGIGDEASILAGSAGAVIAYRTGRFSGLVEVLAPAASPMAVRTGAERVARIWATQLAASTHPTSGGTR